VAAGSSISVAIAPTGMAEEGVQPMPWVDASGVPAASGRRQRGLAPVEVHLVDAFTDRAFLGNPAGVCLLDREAPAGWMQQLASELNLPETAFLVPRADGYGLRWFTPSTEVDLCGHGTLASAHVLWEAGRCEARTVRFWTASGVLTARRESGEVALSFPLLDPEPTEPPAELLAALRLPPARVVHGARCGSRHLVRLASEGDVLAVAPDYPRLRRFPGTVAVTAPAEHRRTDFASRYFAPSLGIDEDSATGSIHCLLAPYWSRLLGKRRLRAVQRSARSGRLCVTVGNDSVELRGSAVTVLRAELAAEARPPR
jgi:PhzF family phenazine biosynthesis protein